MRFPSLIIAACYLLSALANGARAFNLNVREIYNPENGARVLAEIEANGEKLSLLVPHDWRISSIADGSGVSLDSRSGKIPFNVRFSTGNAEPLIQSAEALRQAIIPLLEEVHPIEEYPAYSGYGAGRGVDYSFVFNGRSMRSRVAVIPLAQGYASFVLTSDPRDWPVAQQIFGSTLTSFRRASASLVSQPQNGNRILTRQQRENRPATQANTPAVADDLPPPFKPELLIPVDSVVVKKPSIFGGKWEYILMGLVFILVSGLTVRTLIRHKREAEIRLLTGKYLMDGVESARIKMPALFVSSFPNSNRDSESEASDNSAERDNSTVVKGPLAEFFAQAPENLAEIRKLIPELGRPAEDAQRRETLLKFCGLIVALKDKANCWDLRPVWQLTSALELLVSRLADKCKEATPSTMRTIVSSVDLLGELCVPGVRPDLIINPPISVLAVDDDPLCLRAVTFALQKAEMIPDTAPTGERALELAAAKYYDVVFMDIQMPGIDGLEACSQIHKGEKNKTTPIVFVTVRSDFHTKAKSTLAGGTDLLAKPFLMFEITVKALTFAMRKRLSLAASLKREIISQSGAKQIEHAAKSVPAEAPSAPSQTPSTAGEAAPVEEKQTVIIPITITVSQENPPLPVSSLVMPQTELREERSLKKRSKRGKRRYQDNGALLPERPVAENRSAEMFIH